MKKNILNLEGVTVLTKQQQKAVNGGNGFSDTPSGGYCRTTLTVTYANGGGTHSSTGTGFYSGTPAQQSAGANASCVNAMSGLSSNPNVANVSCTYDCEHDGWGR